MTEAEISQLKATFRRLSNERVEKWERLGNESMVVRAKADAVTAFGLLCSSIDALQFAATAPAPVLPPQPCDECGATWQPHVCAR